MKEKLVFDDISYTKTEPLTQTEVALMKKKITKQLKIYVPGYLILTAIGIYIWLRGPNSMNDFRRRNYIKIDDQTTTLFWTVAPYFCIFLFFLTTAFLLIYYLQSIRPFVKDIKEGKKMTVFYKPKKTAMSLFNQYYITIPLYSNQQIKINKDDFENINEGDFLCLEIGPSSTFLLGLRNKEKNIHVDDLTL